MPEAGRGDLTHAEWARLQPLLPGGGLPGGRWCDKILCSLLAHADAEDRIDWSMVGIDPPPAGPISTRLARARHPRASRDAGLCPLSIGQMKGWDLQGAV